MSQLIDSQNLDVIIIGAGPAGGSAARELSKRGKKVLLIEQSKEVGQPSHSTAGTPKETMDDFELPSSIISSEWNKMLVATSQTKATWTYPATMGYVLNFAALDKFLAEDAAKHGAEILVGTSVKDFIKKDNEIIGVRYQGALGDGEAKAPLIIDATGHYELANMKLGINPVTSQYLSDAMEYQMVGLPKELHSTLACFLGKTYAPNGYAWVFPMKQNTAAKVGVCRYWKNTARKKLSDTQEQFLVSLPYFKKMEPIEIHAGSARLDGGVKNHVYKNILIIGDAARQINPLVGEGIRHALSSGRLVAEVIDDCLQDEKVDQAALKKKYERLWKKKFSQKWKYSFLCSKFLYHKLNDDQLDRLVKVFQDITPEDVFEISFHFAFKKLFKYPRIISTLLSFGINLRKLK